MNIKLEIIKIAKALSAFDSQPLRKRPDYGCGQDIQHQLAEHAGLDLDQMWKEKTNATTEDKPVE